MKNIIKKRDYYFSLYVILGAMFFITVIAYFIKDISMEIEKHEINSKDENKAIISEIQKKENEIKELKKLLIK